ncbi:NADH-quinone oxidoreductase subunit J [Candidatus Erwinia haradaeae]|uniref:NADH-quinone oxidoreductase subunit J n=1 Tax=Candidatus Erwinia haradaeae TaxID=1922217 RepID=A0A451D7B0_9GAMM|nr:NADH-quinone oxidoreductase subunit J [Candidatus Erwinia haradaeae]VFP81739.1 NADH-quinone oxidoreductase subunit J [Candidatus Erwinia haradaeae]
MDYVFYLCGLASVLATIFVIKDRNPIHALLYLIISFLSVSGVFFSLGAYFAGALEIIVYAGAILVLFVFVIMMLNLGRSRERQVIDWSRPSLFLSPGLFSLLFFGILIYSISSIEGNSIVSTIIDGKQVGMELFSSYPVMVELVSMLLLSGLIVAYHIGRELDIDTDAIRRDCLSSLVPPNQE